MLVNNALVCVESNTKPKDQSLELIIYCATLVHVSSDMRLFTSFTVGNHGRVRMGNGRYPKTKRIENVRLNIDSEIELVLRDIKYMPIIMN